MDTIALLDLDRGAIAFYKITIRAAIAFYKNRIRTAIAFYKNTTGTAFYKTRMGTAIALRWFRGGVCQERSNPTYSLLLYLVLYLSLGKNCCLGKF